MYVLETGSHYVDQDSFEFLGSRDSLASVSQWRIFKMIPIRSYPKPIMIKSQGLGLNVGIFKTPLVIPKCSQG